MLTAFASDSTAAFQKSSDNYCLLEKNWRVLELLGADLCTAIINNGVHTHIGSS